MKKIAIVGVEGSGKTVLLTVMGDKYSTPNANGVFLKPMNGSTFSYYTRQAANLRSGEWPLATESSVLKLDWTLMRKSTPNEPLQQLGQLSFLDFGGEIYRRAFGGRAQSELDQEDEQRRNAVEELKSHVKNADILIVLVNLGDIINGKNNNERTVEMNWLSLAILSFAYEQVGMRDVALVFTQADAYAKIISSCGGVRGALAEYLKEVDASYGDRLHLFRVSAVNKTVPSQDRKLQLPAKKIDSEKFDSEGLEELMAWIVERIAPPTVRKGRWGWWAALAFCITATVGVAMWFCYKTNYKVAGWVNDTVYKWIGYRVEGVRNPNNPNLIAGADENTWVATRPGYVWVQGTDKDEWRQGLRHPDNSRLISEAEEGKWKSTEEGYVWIGGSNTEWRAGIKSAKHPHWFSVISGEHPTGYWELEPGYSQKYPNVKGSWDVVWSPGLMDGDSRRATKQEGKWEIKCHACSGKSVRCAACEGKGRIETGGCPECHGSGTVERMMMVKCPNCGGRFPKGKVQCPKWSITDNIYTYPEPTLLGGPKRGVVDRNKHVVGKRTCPTCHGMGQIFESSWWGGSSEKECITCGGAGYFYDLCSFCNGLRYVDCKNCGGSGEVPRKTNVICDRCGGTSRPAKIEQCRACEGQGSVPVTPSCHVCDGVGWVAE